jgi:tRNA(Ile)-lysidine synthase
MPCSLPDSIRQLADKTGILPYGATVLVAVSGGQDSCALLHALTGLRNNLGITLYAAHLNHGFRGEAADGDAAFVRELADSLDVPCMLEKQDVAGIAKRMHLSKQEAARRARHDFLDRTADAIGAEIIALGHTRDDRIETALLNIIRGTGIDGLTGLTPQSGRRIRPLLEVSRDDTAAHCNANAIAFREDASNLSSAYTRNRIRSELLPLVESYYHPGFRTAILRLADLAEQDSAVLSGIARREFQRALLNSTEGCVVLDTEPIRGLDRAIQRRVVRHAIHVIRGSLQDVEAAAIDRTLALLGENQPRFKFRLPNGDISVELTGNRLIVAKEVPQRSTRRVEYALDCPGSVFMPEFKTAFEARCGGEAGVNGIAVSAGDVSFPLTIRNRRPGDRLRPVGLDGMKKVQDILVDAKVPAELRDLVPIVADAQGILWVVGHAVDERCLATSPEEQDGSAIVIEIIPRPNS